MVLEGMPEVSNLCGKETPTVKQRSPLAIFFLFLFFAEKAFGWVFCPNSLNLPSDPRGTSSHQEDTPTKNLSTNRSLEMSQEEFGEPPSMNPFPISYKAVKKGDDFIIYGRQHSAVCCSCSQPQSWVYPWLSRYLHKSQLRSTAIEPITSRFPINKPQVPLGLPSSLLSILHPSNTRCHQQQQALLAQVGVCLPWTLIFIGELLLSLSLPSLIARMDPAMAVHPSGHSHGTWSRPKRFLS